MLYNTTDVEGRMTMVKRNNTRLIAFFVMIMMLLASCGGEAPDVTPVAAKVTEYVNTVEAYGNAEHSVLRLASDGKFALLDNYSAGTNEMTGTWSLSDGTYTLNVESSKIGNYRTIVFEAKDENTLVLKTDLLGSKAEQVFSSDPNAELISLSNEDDFPYGQFDNISKINSFYRSYIILYPKGTFSYVDTDSVNSIVIGGKFKRSNDRFTCTYADGGAQRTFGLQIREDGALVLLNDLGDSRTGDVFSAKPDPGDPDARIPCVGIQIMNMRPNVDDDDPGWNIQAEPMPKDTTDEMVYSSGDNTILTIDQNGNVTVHKSGNTYIQVVCGDAQKTVYIQVNPTGVFDVYFNPGAVSIDLGSSIQLNAIVQSKTGNEKLTYYSDDPSIAQVNSSGYVTGLDLGMTRIYAKAANGVEGYCNVYVNGEKVVISSATVTLKPGEVISLPVRAYHIINQDNWYNKEDIWYELEFHSSDQNALFTDSVLALHASSNITQSTTVTFWYTWSDGSSLSGTSPICTAYIVP